MNRPLSMTAFGRGEISNDERSWVIEIRSVNHRYCDVRIKIPRQYMALEENIKKKISSSYSRGHVDAIVTLTGQKNTNKKLETNVSLVKQYGKCLNSIRRTLSLAYDPATELALVSNFPEVITSSEETEDVDKVWQDLEPALDAALLNALAMREREGQSLKNDLQARLEEFTRIVGIIEGNLPAIQKQRETTLSDRLETLLAGIDLDPMRLSQEVVILVDKSDITEEMVRLKSHIDQFNHFLQIDEPAGRRLDFLLQEFLREVNTMASKMANAQMAHHVVDLKNEIEKLREQVQNLE